VRDRVVGRERELAAIEGLLAASGPGVTALVIEGEPGIGKTTVWEAAFERAAGRDLQVLVCRPVEAEARLAFAALGDLLAPIVDGGLPALPDPQRIALEVALLRAAPSGAPPDRRAVGTAVCSLLRRSAVQTPVVLAIDDVQWLDQATAGVLSFALRRLEDSPIRVLAAVRRERGAAADPLDLERTLRGRIERLRLGPLSLSSLYHVIRTQRDQVFPRPTLQRITAESGGNPFFALELARALDEIGARPGPGEPLPVPGTLAGLMRGRIDRLPQATRDALLAAAALSSPDARLISAALGREASESLAAAERADVVVIREGLVRFSHPLLASTVYASASPEQRRALHGRLAKAIAEPEQQARHLALAAEGPAESVAARLDSAARHANARGAPEAAAELAELACRLTPASRVDEHASRSLALAGYAFRAGDTGHARRLVEGVMDEQARGPLRARALELLARMLHVAGTAAVAAALCEEALGEAGSDIELQARIHATFALVSWHDFQIGREHARAALDLLERLDDPDPGVLAQALMAYLENGFYTGRGLPPEILERALELEQLAPAASVSDRVSASLGVWLKYQGDFEGARRWLEAAHRAALEEGDEASLPYVVGHLPQLELWSGNWSAAEHRAIEHLDLAESTAQPDQRRQALFNLSLVHAHLGRAEEARTAAEALQLEAEQAGDQWGVSNAAAVLGLLELSLGHPSQAADHLARTVELREAIGTSEPVRAYADYAEALIEIGSLDRADGVIRLLEERARATDRVPLLAISACCRGLLAAARQDLDAASAALEEALAQHERVTVPFDLARTLVVLGQVRRRRGERKAAREAFERARSIFEELGAPLWIARAQAELRRIPIRRRGVSDELTPTEQRVAELAGSGRTNREVAQELFMSPKTVGVNLTRVYRKLGIRSRAELGAKMVERNLGEPAPKS
jgi:DNA-binding CsgD family transcriptional regulator